MSNIPVTSQLPTYSGPQNEQVLGPAPPYSVVDPNPGVHPVGCSLQYQYPASACDAANFSRPTRHQRPHADVRTSSRRRCQRRDVTLVSVESYSSQKMLAFCVALFCNPLFGFVAFLLATMAESSKHTNPEKARRLGNTSTKLSVVGIVATCMAALIVAVIFISS